MVEAGTSESTMLAIMGHIQTDARTLQPHPDGGETRGSEVS